MPSKKVYLQEGFETELTIHFNTDDNLYVELNDPNDCYGLKCIVLPIEDARDIITELNEQLKLIDAVPLKF